MKKLLLLVVFMSTTTTFAQDYLDVIRLNIAGTRLDNLDDARSTDVQNVNLEVLYPVPLGGKTTGILGFTYENTAIDNYFVKPQFQQPTIPNEENLAMLRINLGAKIQHNRKWTGTYVLLPKLATNWDDIDGDGFQFGALAMLDYKFKSRKRAKFGVYTSSERFGQIITPLLGGYYRSPNGKFYADATFPIRAEANYALTSLFGVGADLRTSVKAYDLGGFRNDFYVQEESIRFSLYASLDLYKGQVIGRAKVGLDTTDYGLYNAGDEVGVQVLTFQVEGDERIRLNSEFDSSMYFGLDLIYRFGL
ncbi:MAG: hypothetical protein WBA16_07535 [Nonlabens sp.]